MSNSTLKALTGVLIVVAAPAFAQPPDSVTSDQWNNTAMGHAALLYQDETGSADDNTAAGADALFFNSTGSRNTALGSNTLTSNTQGSQNTAAGYGALYRNTSGGANSAFGAAALYSNTSGLTNTAMGGAALTTNSSGEDNAAFGYYALQSNATGRDNTALGTGALANNATGEFNIVIGSYAGINIVGSNNIDIGNDGNASDNGVVRIGAHGVQKSVFVAGVSTKKITGSAVFITAAGELGVLASSERYKTAISSMGEESSKLRQLRPVTFHLKSEPNGALQFGLIAEEVDKIYPDLVLRDETGKVQGVRYDELAPLLLNEVQRLDARVRQQNEVLASDAADRAALREELAALKRQTQLLQAANKSTQAMLAKFTSGDRQFAMR